jgi:CDP-glycerol glycerophosphotransferase
VRRAAPGSLQWIHEISTARVYVDNFNRPFYQIKFPDQKYVQTWHGDRGFKRVLYDMDPDGGYPDYKYIDLAVAGSDFCEKMYRTAFRYEGEVLKVGLPRNDRLVNPMSMAQARRLTGLPENKRVLLYAPTFRDSARGGMFRPPFDLAAAVQALREGTGEDWICAARAHDMNAGVAGADIDVTDYPDMAELMMASDMLLTDYSSCAGDFPLLGRPVILYHPAERFERGLYFDIENSPFRIAHDEAELRDLLTHAGGAEENARDVLAFFGTSETGKSAEAVAKRICAWLDGRDL